MATTTLEAPTATVVPAVPADYAARAAEVVDLLRSEARAIEEQRALTPAVLQALVDRNLFQVLLEPFRTGARPSLASAVAVLETLARGDGSTGWDVMASMGGTFLAGFLRPEARERIFASPSDAAATAVGRMGKAVAVEGGYVVDASWPFLSGSPHATWIGGLAMVHDGDEPRMVDGQPVIVIPLIRKERVTLLDTWYATGLSGTGSHVAEVDGVFVPEDETVEFFRGPQPETPLFFLIDENVAAPLAGGGVAIGIAQGALDAYREIIKTRTNPAGVPATEAPLPRLAAVQAETKIAQARALVQQRTREVDAMVEDGRLPGEAEIRSGSLAATGAVELAIEAVSMLYRAAGTASVFTGSPLDRALRDIYTLGAHRMFQGENYLLHG